MLMLEAFGFPGANRLGGVPAGLPGGVAVGAGLRVAEGLPGVGVGGTGGLGGDAGTFVVPAPDLSMLPSLPGLVCSFRNSAR